METYKVTKGDLIITGLTFDQAADTVIGFGKGSKMEIEVKPIKKADGLAPKIAAAMNIDAVNAYRETLSASELSKLKEGRAKISHNKEQGFYLRSVTMAIRNETEIRISLEARKKVMKDGIFSLISEMLNNGVLADVLGITEDCEKLLLTEVVKSL